MRNLLFALITLFLFTQNSRSETPAAESETPERKIVSDQLLLLELEMAESGYTLNASLENKIRLLNIYEKIVFSGCMHNLHQNLTFQGVSGDEVCMEYINKIFEHDAGNVVAFCAANGIDSLNCKTASLNQNKKVFDPQKEEKTGKASVDEVISTRRDGPEIREETLKLIYQLRALRAQKRDRTSIHEEKKIMEQILNLNCRRIRISLAAEVMHTPTPTPPQEGSTFFVPIDATPIGQEEESPKKKDAFAELLETGFPTPTPAADLPKSHRVYEIPKNCDEYIKEALQMDPQFATAICYENGFYSWQCINAKRLERRLSQPTPAAQQPLTGTGIQKF